MQALDFTKTSNPDGGSIEKLQRLDLPLILGLPRRILLRPLQPNKVNQSVTTTTYTVTKTHTTWL
jgi:hypothetical protein